VEIPGRQDTKEKNRSEQAFMSGETNVCLISLRAAAGLNLQRATCVVFGELDWSPAVHSQAEDRAHRMGQKDSVLCYYLVAEEGTDETIQEFLGLKVSQFVGIMGDKEETEEDRAIAQSVATQHMNKIVERLKTCYNKVEKGGGKNEQNKKPEPDIICAGCQ
jgi:SNF2 family DNA or RNA helicase